MRLLSSSFTLGFLLFSTQLFAQDTLVFAIDIVRHGDRTPLIASAEMEKIWPQGTGQLTPIGMRQEYDLGKRLRDFYVHQTKFLPLHYDAKTMEVRSSDLQRTLMSAQSILLGLYPLGSGPILADKTHALPSGFQPIPIHTVPAKQDELLIPGRDKKKYKEFLETYVYTDPVWIAKDTQLRPYYPVWAKALHAKIDHLSDLGHISDQLEIERLYHVPAPQGLQDSDVDTIIEAGIWDFVYISNKPELTPLFGQELAQLITQEMIAAAKQEKPLKYRLFVAHDTTLVSQLKRLGQTIKAIPPYAARLHYALFDKGGAHYEIRVDYCDKPLWIEACGGYACSLDDFERLLSSQHP